VIEVCDVSKTFSIPHQRPRTLFHHIFPFGRSYETFPALSGIELRVGRGEFVGIVGDNGSGKSTLLRIVAGIYPPTGGSIRVDGAVAPILDLGVGFQGSLTVRDNVLLYGVLLGIPRHQLRDELGLILERAGVERFAETRLEALSTGLRARLAFTVALRADAPILLLDEALAVGDETFRRRCLEDLAELRARSRTVLCVSHDLDLLGRLCGRLVVMRSGRIHGDGPPDAMIRLYRELMQRI
jgi:lipopolysaccharide transport system ATP-binding protein